MPYTNIKRSMIAVAAILFTMTVALSAANAQERKVTPDISVASVKLGDRASAKAFLDGYQYRTDGGLPTYYFYNSRVTTVLKLTGRSFDDPYFITEIEVFGVGQEYQKRHFVLDRVGHFLTETGIHIGFRQSGADIAFAMTVGVPGVVGDSITRPDYVVKKIGNPSTRAKNGEEETFDYLVDSLSLTSAEGKADYRYTAHYRFYKRKLNRFILKIEPLPVAK